MTPTEQDELRKAVWASLASQITHAINCTDLEHEEQDSCEDFTKKNFEQLMQLITADRKRVALEARIAALDTIHKRLAASDLNTKHYKIISKMLIESKEGYREAMKQEKLGDS